MEKNKNKAFYLKEKTISKFIFAVVMTTAFALVFGPAIQAHFYRTTGDSGWGYGFGYGYGEGYGTSDGSYRSEGSAGDVYEYNYGYGSLISAPSITTSAASSVVSSSATLNGNITATGDNTPTARGFQYGLTTDYGSTAASSGSSFGTGTFSENISGLTCGGTTYHFRAYATNIAGTTYGSDTTFVSAGCGGGGGGSAYIPPVVPPVVEEEETEEEAVVVDEEEAAQEEAAVEEDLAADAPVTADGIVAVEAAKGGQTTLTTADGAEIKVTVPKNAVAANTTVNVSEVAASAVQASAPIPSGKTLVGSAYSMQAVQGSTAVTAFQKDVDLTFTYTNAQISGLSESSLKVYYWNNTQWIALPTTVNTTSNTITATVDHFTYFAIMGTPEITADSNTASLAYSNGSLLKVKGNPTIWLIEDALKHGIPSAGIFESKFRWQDIIEILSSSTLEQYETGDSLKYPDGTLIMGSDKTVYAVSDNGKKRGFTSAQIFLGLGYKWENIVAVADAEIARYATGTLISSTTTHPTGSLINNNGTIFQIDSTNKLRGIPTPSVFTTNRLDWGNVVTATAADKALTIGPNLSFPDGTIVKEKGKLTVYVIADQKKRGFTSAAAFTSRGYKWDNIIEATEIEVTTLTDGELLE